LPKLHRVFLEVKGVEDLDLLINVGVHHCEVGAAEFLEHFGFLVMESCHFMGSGDAAGQGGHEKKGQRDVLPSEADF